MTRLGRLRRLAVLGSQELTQNSHELAGLVFWDQRVAVGDFDEPAARKGLSQTAAVPPFAPVGTTAFNSMRDGAPTAGSFEGGRRLRESMSIAVFSVARWAKITGSSRGRSSLCGRSTSVFISRVTSVFASGSDEPRPWR